MFEDQGVIGAILPPEALGENPFLASSSYWCLPTILGVSWFVGVSLPVSASSSHWPPSLCLSIKSPSAFLL